MRLKFCYFCAFLAFIFGAATSFGKELKIHSYPRSFQSDKVLAKINGQTAQVFQAGLNVYFISFDFSGEVDIEISAKTRKPGFWNGQAFLSPASKKIDVKTEGNSASFKILENGQYALRKEGCKGEFQDFAVFVFANPPEKNIPNFKSSDVVYLEKGVHWKNIDLKSNQTLYLDSGAVLFGGINIFNAENVRICGRGTVVYSGPVSQERDEGYIVKPDWHPLTVDNVKNLKIEGVSFVNRARTWTIQTRKTFDSEFDNIKILALCHENVNGDGIDFLGGGNSKITNSLIRSADDCVAFFTAFAGNDKEGEGMYALGKTSVDTVENIHIENCLLWPTLADILRMGFNGQNLHTNNISFKNCDILKMGEGFWFAPWAIFCVVTSNDTGKPLHQNYLFEDLRFETPVALMGVQNSKAVFENFTFKNISMTGPELPSMMLGSAKNFKYENVTIDGKIIKEPKFSEYEHKKKK